MAAREAATKQVMVDDKTHNAWVQEVKALKPRKQKSWQSSIHNQRGEKSRIRFNVETGDLENYSPAHEARDCKKLSATWVQVVPMSRVRQDNFIPFPAVGHAFKIDDEAGRAALIVERQANYTGNHQPRNHFVKVPTAPSEPCRG